MAARDDSRRDAENEGVARNGVEREDSGARRYASSTGRDGTDREEIGHADVGNADVGHGDVGNADIGRDGRVYAGMDALMAALLDEPLPEQALEDAEFMAARDAAAADVALLREQLGFLGEALAVTGDDAGAPPGRPAAARPGDAAGAETDPGRVSGPATAPTASVTPLLPRPDRARRALSIAYKGLAAAAVASVVLVLGWGFTQTEGSSSTAKSDSAADGAAASRAPDQQSDGGGDSGSLSRQGYVACSRIIVEGTVTEVQPVPGAAQDRITVDVRRWIKPEKGGKQIVFPMDQDVDPRLKEGDHVLVGIPRHDAHPDVWTTDEAQIARDGAWMEEALPGSEELSCE
ncbi:putative membrane protein [Streptomyces scabiei 87.22]|uniref:Putative membrane protein n=1 Tax=Streptomyces scabiei (strain 87.22) TaxID=680198 RepID=C9Z7B9_STRSW|nr:hypothetical protein [Streptomyces scabiei]MDX2579834.1 hypothetical protein [Streptomyces scabiei]MDX2656711.1 hypothetical protein [Streptomyces scabiei]MDX2722639.1 hypothetical protein [Streptomyces scabiei]MDX2868059.1 hypothetical protein [Streptomyces scabiei]MDX2888017.1 hypothetical protein [Streptomyces scabiei]